MGRCIVLAGVVAALLALSGCAGDEAAAPAPVASPAVAEAPAAEAAERSEAECGRLAQEKILDPAFTGTMGDLLRQVGGCDAMAGRYDAAMCASNAGLDTNGDCIVDQGDADRRSAAAPAPPGPMSEAECMAMAGESTLPNSELGPMLRSVGCDEAADAL